jgi:glycosyltransferase involved in cell wall biosynthesis
VLLEAFALMLSRGVDGFLTIVGDGELREILDETIRAKHLEGRVEITGWADEKTVRDYIHGARALVLPSFAEGLPVVIMEALALARPVISTWIAGIPELVSNSENGWLIAPSDVPALASAMQEALEMPVDQLNSMGASGRAKVMEAHSTEREAQKLSELFVLQTAAT